MRHELGRENAIFVHVTLVPWIAAAHELKTKPTQHSVKELRAIGIQPDICSAVERFLNDDVRSKIALFCDVEQDAVITANDVASVYEVPLSFAAQNVDDTILRLLKLDVPEADMGRWSAMVERVKSPMDEVDIGLVGKYVEYEDSYKSLKEALLHGGLAHNLKVRIHWIDAETLADAETTAKTLRNFDGIRAGRVRQARRGRNDRSDSYSREADVPYFGIFGNADDGDRVCPQRLRTDGCGFDGIRAATLNRVIYKLRELKGVDELGGTMRLGAYPCALAEGSLAYAAYGKSEISERHRHRFEFNRKFEPLLTANGLRITGESPGDRTYVEICEIPGKHWFLGCQFHPEFKSKPMEPHPLFASFVDAAYRYRRLRVAPLTTVAETADAESAPMSPSPVGMGGQGD